MKKTLLGIFATVASCSYAQKPAYTANDTVAPYNGTFAFGTNVGYYSGYNGGSSNDKQMADLMVKTGLYSLRPKLFESFTTEWGYNVRLSEFQYYTQTKGMHDITLFVMNGISEANRATETVTCNGTAHRSELFKNMYLPIWDDSDANKTPINENNPYALFIYNIIKTYGDYIRFLEVWNEPDWTASGLGDKKKGEAGNWWDNNPNPCDLPKLYGSVQQYIRLMRITYEVVKAVKPSVYVTTGGIGYASFLDACLRMTDNPDAGKVTTDYPLKGGAYFDVLSYHCYPQYNLGVFNYTLNKWEYMRHSDFAVQEVWNLKGRLNAVLKTHGYDGTTFPEKHWILTECNVPRKYYGGSASAYIGGAEVQRNFDVKAFVLAQKNGVRQLYTYTLGDTRDESASTNSEDGMDMMGMYFNLNKATPTTAQQAPAGIATKTLTGFIHGFSYDAAKTAALKLPSTADGAAFTKGAQTYYVIWAKTTTDLSEAASVNYTIPGTLMPGATSYAWDYSSTGASKTLTSPTIALTGSPIILKADFWPTSIEEEEMEKASVQLYPNPAKSELTIQRSALQGALIVELIDLNGKTIRSLEVENPSQTISIADLTAGVYQVKCNGSHSSWIKKLVVE